MKSKTEKSKKQETELPSDYVLGLRMDRSLAEDLKKLADADERKLSDYARRVLKEHVADKLKK